MLTQRNPIGGVVPAFWTGWVNLRHDTRRRTRLVADWSSDRWLRIKGMFTVEGSSPLGEQVITVAKELLASDAVSLCMQTDGFLTAINGGDEAARALDEVQFTVGTGPTIDALTAHAPIVVPDLRRIANGITDVTFVGAAQRAGIAGMVAFPMRVGAARLGVLTSYRNEPGWVSAEQYADGLVLASIATTLLLEEQARQSPGTMSDPFEAGLQSNAEVHLAAGMLSERLQVSVADALVRLRSAAFARDIPLHILARQFVSGQTEIEK